MKRLRNIILILIVAIIVIIVSIVVILKLKTNETKITNEIAVDESEVETDWEEVKQPTTYYAIDSIISKFFEQMSIYNPSYTPIITGGMETGQISEEILQEEAKYAREEAGEILEQYLKNYINDKNISTEELEKLYEEYSDVTLSIDKLYYRQLKDFIQLYYIDGTLSKNDEQYDVIIVVNSNENSFTILPNEYILEKFGENTDLSKINIEENLLNIEKNAYNKISYDSITLEEMAKKYFYNYMYNLTSNPKKVYETLDEEYREARFESYENFVKYVKDNYETLTARSVKQYSVYDDSSDNTIMYICKDQNECYYIFKASAVMDYTLILDNHTKYIEKMESAYSSADEKEKASMNIEKIIDAVNTKDYEYIYNKFDSSLKSNSFNTQTDLEKFISENMFEYNSLDYENTNVQNEKYGFRIKLTNVLDNSAESKNINIVLQLSDDTDFTITSFSI